MPLLIFFRASCQSYEGNYTLVSLSLRSKLGYHYARCQAHSAHQTELNELIHQLSPPREEHKPYSSLYARSLFVFMYCKGHHRLHSLFLVVVTSDRNVEALTHTSPLSSSTSSTRPNLYRGAPSYNLATVVAAVWMIGCVTLSYMQCQMWC